MSATRVLVAEDEVLLREGLLRLLDEAGFEVVACVADGDEIVPAVEAHRPEVAVLDIRMPPTNSDEGLRAAEVLAECRPEVGVLILSQHDDPRYALRLLESRKGGVGYLLKERVADLDVFADSVRRVAAGGTAVDREIVRRLVDRKRARDPLAELSQREREVLALMAEGRSNDAIERALVLSGKTVESHVRNVFRKLGLAEMRDDHRRVLAVVAFLRSQG